MSRERTPSQDNLYLAASNGDNERLKSLIDQGVSPNFYIGDIRNNLVTHKTPMCAAIEQGHQKIVETLLLSSVDVDQIVCYYHDQLRQSVRGRYQGLHIAAKSGKQEIIELLLFHGAVDSDHSAANIAWRSGQSDIAILITCTEIARRCLKHSGQLPEIDVLKEIDTNYIDNIFEKFMKSYPPREIESAKFLIKEIKNSLGSSASLFDKKFFELSRKNELNELFIVALNSDADENYKLTGNIRQRAFLSLQELIKDLPDEEKLENLQWARTQPIFCKHRSSFFTFGRTNTVVEIDKMIKQLQDKIILKQEQHQDRRPK